MILSIECFFNANKKKKEKKTAIQMATKNRVQP